MLDFADQPYRFTPPAPNRLVAFIFKRLNYRWYLPRKQRITSVTVSGRDELIHARREGDAVLFLPNHPTHSDAAIFIEAQRQAGSRTRMMAAYDVFLRSRIDAWIMRKLGAFSVDREGSDQRSMKEAMRTLTELSQSGWALTIFPEGNVYLEGERVTPFNDGASFLALRAAKELAESGRRVLIVPVSIKVTHTTDQRSTLIQALARLAGEVGVTIDAQGSPIEALKTIGLAAMHRNLKQRGLDQPQAEDLPTLIHAAADAVLRDLERKLDITPKPGDTPIDRVRAARRIIHEVRTDTDRAIDHAAARVWADQAMLAFRFASYSGRYVGERPTLDRVAETIDKLDEDLHGRWPTPNADRAAFVHFNTPIDLTSYLSEKRTRDAVRKLTADCEAAVQAGLEALCESNPHEGGKPW